MSDSQILSVLNNDKTLKDKLMYIYNLYQNDFAELKNAKYSEIVVVVDEINKIIDKIPTEIKKAKDINNDFDQKINEIRKGIDPLNPHTPSLSDSISLITESSKNKQYISKLEVLSEDANEIKSKISKIKKDRNVELDLNKVNTINKKLENYKNKILNLQEENHNIDNKIKDLENIIENTRKDYIEKYNSALSKAIQNPNDIDQKMEIDTITSALFSYKESMRAREEEKENLQKNKIENLNKINETEKNIRYESKEKNSFLTSDVTEKLIEEFNSLSKKTEFTEPELKRLTTIYYDLVKNKFLRNEEKKSLSSKYTEIINNNIDKCHIFSDDSIILSNSKDIEIKKENCVVGKGSISTFKKFKNIFDNIKKKVRNKKIDKTKEKLNELNEKLNKLSQYQEEDKMSNTHSKVA